jgi:hypothetical protein
MSTRSLTRTAATPEGDTHTGRSVKKTYLLVLVLAFLLNLMLALTVSSTGKALLTHMGVRHVVISGQG